MVDVRRDVIEIAGETFEASASLNNCSGLWTAVLKSGDRIRASGAGFSPEEAIRVAAELLPEATAVRPGA
jgi:hypothetical protein